MRLRTKLLLSGGAFVLGALAAYAFLIPCLQTGYDRVMAQQAEDQQQIDAERLPASLRPAESHDATTTGIAKSGALSSSAAVAPFEVFGRAWGALDQLNPPVDNSPSSHSEPYRKIESQLLNYINQRSGKSMLAAHGGGDLEGLDLAAPETEPIIRERLGVVMRQTVEHLAGKGLQNWQEYAVKDNVDATTLAAQARAVAPPAPALELLHLPPGAIPAFPMNGNYGWEWERIVTLFHAWLFSTNEPGYDAAAGLRRLHELYEFMRLRTYPAFIMQPDNLRHLVLLAAMGDRLSSASLKAVSGELLRLADEYREPDGSRLPAIRRYQARVMNDQMTNRLQAMVSGGEINNNTFSFMLSGHPARLWFRANAGQLQRKIDQYAVAWANGEAEQIAKLSAELLRQLRVANVREDQWKADLSEMMDHPNESATKYREAALELALWSWRRDHGRLPEHVADLFPDYLPEAARAQVLDKQVWLIQETPTHPVLWHVGFRPFNAQERQMYLKANDDMLDDTLMQSRIREVERSKGRPFTDEERKKIEQARDKFKQDYAKLRARGGFFEASGTVLF